VWKQPDVDEGYSGIRGMEKEVWNEEMEIPVPGTFLVDRVAW